MDEERLEASEESLLPQMEKRNLFMGASAGRRLVFRCAQSPGDAVMLSAAIRDLHLIRPEEYKIDVRSACPDIFEHNPYLTPIADDDATAEWIDCAYPLITRSNFEPIHFLHGFHHFLASRIGASLRPTAFKGDIHLSGAEKAWMSQVHEVIGSDIPFWIIAAGGKYDFTIKWWEHARWQGTVDAFRGRALFVQVGDPKHFHPKLNGVLDLRGKTTLRQLIRLVYHAQGVLCPVTCLMHLAAAVPMKPGSPKNRPCVVVAGGREPPNWEAYPHHQYLHTVGQLPCCDNGGCWKSRTYPLFDGAEFDRVQNLCVSPTKVETALPHLNGSVPPDRKDVLNKALNYLPRCMDLITAEQVIHAVERYFDGGVVKYLSSEQWQTAAAAVERYEQTGGLAPRVAAVLKNGKVKEESPQPEESEEERERRKFEAVAQTKHRYPAGKFKGKGIVILGGGPKYFRCAWVCINMLRRHGCKLPIELWHLGAAEMSPEMQEMVEPLGVRCVDGAKLREDEAAGPIGGWELKCYAILRSRFKEVLLLDADIVPLRDPSFLFSSTEYQQSGALFWPDIGRLGPKRDIWRICNVPYRDEPEFESGQIVIDKRRSWHPLHLAMHMNERSSYFYRFFHGDKETFHIAWRRLKASFAMPKQRPACLPGTLCQHDFAGKVLFQHRSKKWQPGDVQRTPGFRFEDQCFELLRALDRSLGTDRSAGKRRGAKTEQTLNLRAHIDASTGYGLHACQIVQDLESLGHRIAISPTRVNKDYGKLPGLVRRALKRTLDHGRWDLIVHPPFIRPDGDKRSIYFSMWETTRLRRESVDYLNLADRVIVPSSWNIETFQESGVTAPIEKVPLGIRAEVFHFREPLRGGKCIFGAAGRSDSDLRRKGIADVIAAFKAAFPSRKDVELRVKVFPHCKLDEPNDPRIRIYREFFNESELAAWFGELTCFISMARGEGWGLMQHQALAVGRPLISVRFGGVAEFFEEAHGFAVGFKMVNASGQFAGCGQWAEPRRSEVVEAMRAVYADPAGALEKGKRAAKDVAKFSWAASNLELSRVLQRAGFLSKGSTATGQARLALATKKPQPKRKVNGRSRAESPGRRDAGDEGTKENSP